MPHYTCIVGELGNAWVLEVDIYPTKFEVNLCFSTGNYSLTIFVGSTFSAVLFKSDKVLFAQEEKFIQALFFKTSYSKFDVVNYDVSCSLVTKFLFIVCFFPLKSCQT